MFLEVFDQIRRVCFEPEVMKHPSQSSIHSEQMSIREYLNTSQTWDSSGIQEKSAETSAATDLTSTKHRRSSPHTDSSDGVIGVVRLGGKGHPHHKCKKGTEG